MIHAEDMTPTLTNWTYWPSYNVPYFADTSKAAGYSPTDWGSAPRHCIFERMHVNATTQEGMERVMRWNDYQHDPCSDDSPWNGIAARGDLVGSASAFGALDAKWASWSSVMGHGSAGNWPAGGTAGAPMKSFANCGPTHEKGQQPVFCWTKKFDHSPHHGHPSCYAFQTVEMAPRTF
jgi:hypothetical protein